MNSNQSQKSKRRQTKRRSFKHYTRYTDGIAEQICQLLQLGMPRSLVAEAVRVGRTTFYKWLEEKEDFRNRVEQAERAAVAHYVARVYQASAEHWQAAAWWLERRYPEEFGRRQVMTVGTKEEPESLVIRLYDVQRFINTGEKELAAEVVVSVKPAEPEVESGHA